MILGSGLIQSSWPRASDWLVRDEFTDTLAAGSVNGTAATPGPGTRAVTDAESKLSVGGGVLAMAGGKATPISGDPALWYGSISSQNGLAAVFCLTSEHDYVDFFYVGFDTNTGGPPAYGMRVIAQEIRNLDNATIGSATTGAEKKLVIVVTGSNMVFLVRSGDEWNVLYSSFYDVAHASLYPAAINYNSAARVDYVRCLVLPAPFDSDTGPATDVHAGSVSAGTTFSHEADCLIEFAVTTLPSADSIDVQFRVQDASNYWICRVNSSGDISLQEVVAGSATQRSNTAGVVANGHRVVIIADGSTIRLYSNNTLRSTYASATNFATATAGELDALGTGGVVSDIITWPRTLSGTAAAILDKASA